MTWRLPDLLRDETGSSPVEFVLVGVLLTLLTLGVVQFALAAYARNVVHDAAVEGAFHAALADVPLVEGEERARELIARAMGDDFVQDVTADETGDADAATVRVTVRATLPLLGLVGAPRGLEVSAHAPAESLG